MRMWMVDPRILCRKHLLGEHVEHHMLVGSLNKKIRMDGYVANNLLETAAIRKRHDRLAAEMLARGMKHKSPLPQYSTEYLPHEILQATVDVKSAQKDLITRCADCRARLDNLKNAG